MRNVIRQKVSDQVVIDKSLIQQAGLGEEIDIIVQDRAIFILPLVKPHGWKIFKSIGENATKGVLQNPSENHDDYLYKRKL